MTLAEFYKRLEYLESLGIDKSITVGELKKKMGWKQWNLKTSYQL